MTTPALTDLEALARELESPSWDASKALTTLYGHRHEPSAVQAIILAMERLSDAELLSCLMQFCQLIIVFELPDLEALLMERCHHSMHFALRMFFLLQAAVEDEIPALVHKTNRLWKECELAAINAESNSPRVSLAANGYAVKKMSKDGASARRSLVLDNPMTASLPTIPHYHAKPSSEQSLYTSMSAIPSADFFLSPPNRHRSTSDPPSPLSTSPSMAKSKSYSQFEELIPNLELDPKKKPKIDPAHPQQTIHTNPNTNELFPTAATRRLELTQTEGTGSLKSYKPPKAVDQWPLHHPNDEPPTLTTTTTTSEPAIKPEPAKPIEPQQPIKLTGPTKPTEPLKPPEPTKPIRRDSTSSDYTDQPSSTISSLSSSPTTYSLVLPTSSAIVPQVASSSSASASASAANSQSEHDKALLGSPFFFQLRLLGGETPAGKQRVYEYFYTELHMVNSLFNISTALMSISLDSVQKQKEVRGRALRLLLQQLNSQLIQSEFQRPRDSLSIDSYSHSSDSSISNDAPPHVVERGDGVSFGIEIPLVPGWVIVKIHPEDSYCLSSRNRIPYMMLIEVICFDPTLDMEEPARPPQHLPRLHRTGEGDGQDPDVDEDWVMLNDDVSKGETVIKMGFVELMIERERRIRATSPFSHLPGWRLAGVIVKSGDDLRQEQLASQVISKIHSWFQAIKLPLFLRPYVVLAISSTTGLIECIPDTASIDSLKKRITNFGSLSNYYICAYGHRASQKFVVAQTNFVESLAAYSLVCYILQIKDRHNGNILLDTEGHVIHIDFGFMLNMSPGNLGFELAPFKLNAEMLDLIGGVNSDMFKYFKTLLLSGLLEIRRHASELLLLVEVMTWHSKMACFARGGAQALAGVRDRLALDKTEEECIALVDTLVYNAMSSWTTQSYDSYQYYTNGIL